MMRNLMLAASIIAPPIVVYGIGAFVSLEANVLEWSDPGRLTLVITSMTAQLMSSLWYFMDRSPTQRL